jgi:hypothetical protein
MVNLKSVTNLPLAESAEGLNLIVNDNGTAKQIAASAVGAQADWAETNENSPAFIKNKPSVDNSSKEFDVDIKVIYDRSYDRRQAPKEYKIQYINNFENIQNKILGIGTMPKGVLKIVNDDGNGGNYVDLYEIADISYSPNTSIIFHFIDPTYNCYHTVYLYLNGDISYNFNNPANVPT